MECEKLYLENCVGLQMVTLCDRKHIYYIANYDFCGVILV